MIHPPRQDESKTEAFNPTIQVTAEMLQHVEVDSSSNLMPFGPFQHPTIFRELWREFRIDAAGKDLAESALCATITTAVWEITASSPKEPNGTTSSAAFTRCWMISRRLWTHGC